MNAVPAPARRLSFRDDEFDLVFTADVLIRLLSTSVLVALEKIVHSSRRYVLFGKYFAERLTEVPYRDRDGALFKRDWDTLYTGRLPELRFVRTGFLPREQDWDDITWWLFEKP